MTNQELILEAKKARERAYTPYSHFKVGAALLTKSGKIYHGCNIENAAYTPTNCAERTAFFKAVYDGEREFAKIAIVGGADGADTDELCAPCGVCRQVMMEFCNPEEFQIILANGEDNYLELSLKELLPYGFGPKILHTLNRRTNERNKEDKLSKSKSVDLVLDNHKGRVYNECVK